MISRYSLFLRVIRANYPANRSSSFRAICARSIVDKAISIKFNTEFNYWIELICWKRGLEAAALNPHLQRINSDATSVSFYSRRFTACRWHRVKPRVGITMSCIPVKKIIYRNSRCVSEWSPFFRTGFVSMRSRVCNRIAMLITAACCSWEPCTP